MGNAAREVSSAGIGGAAMDPVTGDIGLELDRRIVVGDGMVEIAGLDVGFGAALKGCDKIWIGRDRLAKGRDGSGTVALFGIDEATVAHRIDHTRFDLDRVVVISKRAIVVALGVIIV